MEVVYQFEHVHDDDEGSTVVRYWAIHPSFVSYIACFICVAKRRDEWGLVGGEHSCRNVKSSNNMQVQETIVHWRRRLPKRMTNFCWNKLDLSPF